MVTVAAATAEQASSSIGGARRQLESSGEHLGTAVVEMREDGGITEKKQDRKNSQDC